MRVRKKKSKNFSKVIFFHAFPNIFKVTYRRSSEQQRICIYTLLYSFWTYAIFWFFWSISLTTSRYLHNLVIRCCSKYVQIKRCFNIHFENDWFSPKETTICRRRSWYVVNHNVCLHTCAPLTMTHAEISRIDHQYTSLLT